MKRNISWPIDGRGGGLWTQTIMLPVYNFTTGETDFLPSSWEFIDGAATNNLHYNALFGITFGLVLMTFIQVIALTPSTKRGLPLFTFTLLAITCEMISVLTQVIIYTNTGWSSMYFSLTYDYQTTQFIASTVALLILRQIMSSLTFLFAQFCFFIQAKAVLSALRITHPLWYILLFGYLIGFGAFTFLWRLMFGVWQSVNEASQGLQYFDWIARTTDIFYAVSIGSWSLIFSGQVGLIVFRRAKLGGSLQRTETLNILLLTGLESMILPLAACIVNLCTISFLPQPEILIMVLVVILLPFGSLWAGSMQSYDKRSHTFTRSAALDIQPPPSGDSEAAAVHHISSEPVPSGLPMNSQGGYTITPCTSSLNVASHTGARTLATPTNRIRPMGIIDALAAHDLVEDDTELEENTAARFRPNYNHPGHIRHPWSPRPENSYQRFPAEQV